MKADTRIVPSQRKSPSPRKNSGDQPMDIGQVKMFETNIYPSRNHVKEFRAFPVAAPEIRNDGPTMIDPPRHQG